jgi:hypothetical protein
MARVNRGWLILFAIGCTKPSASTSDASIATATDSSITHTADGTVIATYDAFSYGAKHFGSEAARARVAAADDMPRNKEIPFSYLREHASGATDGDGRSPPALVLSLAWTLRDDLLFEQREIVAARIAVAKNGGCAITGSIDEWLAVRIDYQCDGGYAGSSSFRLFAWGPEGKRGDPRPVEHAPQLTVAFPPGSTNLPSDAATIIDPVARVLEKNRTLMMCLAVGLRDPLEHSAADTHVAALRSAFKAKNVADNQVRVTAYTTRVPVGTIEFWAMDTGDGGFECSPPTRAP